MFRHAPAIALLMAVAACEHQSSSATSSQASLRCGNSGLTGVTWVGTAGWVGAGIGVFGLGFYGGWYDPGDTFNPVTDEGDVNGGGDYYTDPSGDPSDDTSTDEPAGDGTTPGDESDDSTGDDGSTQSLKPLTGNMLTGCFTCTVGCTATNASGQRVGQQAVGVSDVSYDDACSQGVASLGGWSHTSLHRPLDTCQQVDPSVSPVRVPAAPTVAQ